MEQVLAVSHEEEFAHAAENQYLPVEEMLRSTTTLQATGNVC